MWEFSSGHFPKKNQSGGQIRRSKLETGLLKFTPKIVGEDIGQIISPDRLFLRQDSLLTATIISLTLFCREERTLNEKSSSSRMIGLN